ncbi:uncharacterized protein DS421_14g455960 [Arachis hypogaea]|nr:uncharacterized protein DS421_14g455960 [Arachis hypogaea]
MWVFLAPPKLPGAPASSGDFNLDSSSLEFLVVRVSSNLMDVLFQVERIRYYEWCSYEIFFDIAKLGDVSIKKLKLEVLRGCFLWTSAGLTRSKTQAKWGKSYIHDMMSTLSKNNSVEKLAEIDLIGFGFLRLVPNWSVKQAIMVHLAESYQVKPRNFILDIGNIRLNAELIGKVFGIPSGGDPFPALDESNLSHVAIKNRFHRRSITKLRDLVYSCRMATESDRMEFRRYFILILKWFNTAVEKYKMKGNKTCEGCMFVMLILYFQRLQYGVLDNSLEHEPWLDVWTSERLEKQAQYILSEGRLLTRHGGGDDIKGRSPQAARRKPGKKEPQKRRQKESVLPRGRSVGGESKQVSKERRPRGRTSSPPPTTRSSWHTEQSETSPRGSCTKKGGLKRTNHVGAPQKNLRKRISQVAQMMMRRMSLLPSGCADSIIRELKKKPKEEPTEGNLNQDKGSHETPVSVVSDAGTLSVALVKYEEWDNPNFLLNRDPESERIWKYFEQLQNTRPLQAVMPTNPSCMTPSPPSKQISLGNAGTEQKYTQCTHIKVHPLLKGRKIDEDDEERVRRWVANGSLEQRQVLASYEGRQHLSLVREDICSLLPWHWVTSNETVLQKRNLDYFREGPTISYVGLGPHFGDDSRFFDKIAASMQKWSVSIDIGGCIPLRLLKKGYGLIEDMTKVSMPAYEHTENGLPRFYASVPQQDNGCDCGVFVIKFMQFWGLDKPLQHWDQDVVQEFRKEIMLDIVMGPHNSEISKALKALKSNHVHRNQPRKKSKAVRSPFTTPSTKSMLQRVGLPTRKPRKGGRQRK